MNSFIAGSAPACPVHRIFEEIAARHSPKTALLFAGGAWSFADLNARANRVARAIQAAGVHAGSPIGVCLERSPELIAALLGILKAGCAYVPLDESYPKERIAYMVRSVAAPLLLTSSELGPRFDSALRAARCTGVLCLDTEATQIERLDSGNLDFPDGSDEAAPERLAYVLFTSGSTGVPKGVMIPHRGIVRLTVGATYARFAPDEVFLQLAPVGFDASTFEIWGALLNGAALALPADGLLSLDEIGSAIERYGVTTLWLTAGLFNSVVDRRLDILRPLRQLLTGGDALSPRHVRKAAEALPGCRLINGYGPTETTTFACCHTVTASDLAGGAIAIGRPIERTSIALLDEVLCAVPDGTPGEIAIGGDGVALGYLNQPALTEQRFVRLPTGELVYRTGDLGRRRSDGAIEFLGRMDDQVKIAGHRVEPKEIEASLTALPGIAQAAVVAHESSHGEKRLSAYIVTSGELALTAARVRAALAERLPAFLIPSDFEFLESLPLSPNGKVDRAQLPRPVFETCHGDERASADLGAVEQLVRAAWRRALGVNEPSIDTNFFDLGGSSLMLLNAHADLERSLARKIPLTTLFEFSSIRALTDYLLGEAPQHDAVRFAASRARLQREALARNHAARSATP